MSTYKVAKWKRGLDPAPSSGAHLLQLTWCQWYQRRNSCQMLLLLLFLNQIHYICTFISQHSLILWVSFYKSLSYYMSAISIKKKPRLGWAKYSNPIQFFMQSNTPTQTRTLELNKQLWHSVEKNLDACQLWITISHSILSTALHSISAKRIPLGKWPVLGLLLCLCLLLVFFLYRRRQGWGWGQGGGRHCWWGWWRRWCSFSLFV